MGSWSVSRELVSHLRRRDTLYEEVMLLDIAVCLGWIKSTLSGRLAVSANQQSLKCVIRTWVGATRRAPERDRPCLEGLPLIGLHSVGLLAEDC